MARLAHELKQFCEQLIRLGKCKKEKSLFENECLEASSNSGRFTYFNLELKNAFSQTHFTKGKNRFITEVSLNWFLTTLSIQTEIIDLNEFYLLKILVDLFYIIRQELITSSL